jgi:hypothetical protein
MTRDIIIFLVIILLILFYYTNYMKEGFANLPSSHNKYTNESAKKFNPIANTVNLVNPVIPLTPANSSLVKNAFNSVDLDPNSANYNVTSGAQPYDIPSDTPNLFKTAKKCESAAVSCSAFDDATFASNCGMSFDTQGTNSDGKEFLGGLYVDPNSRVSQLADSVKARNLRQNPYLTFQPTIGTAKPGTFSLTKDDCTIVKEKVDCEKKQTFDSPNCTQCYTSREFARVGPESQKIPCKLYLQGHGRYQTNGVNNPEGQKRGSLPFSPNVTVEFIFDQEEGHRFVVLVYPDVENDPKLYISGYMEGSTPKGTFKLDLLHLVELDYYSDKKPRISGTVKINGFQCARMIPQKNKYGARIITLVCQIPFSFIDTNDYEAGSCANGPVITKASSAIFLNSDACFNKDNKPGNYSLECLQSRWLAMGGTSDGTGYPSDKAKADGLQKNPDGSPLPIETIIDNLSVIMLRALTGKNAAGKQLSIRDWNISSMFATGREITSPCDTEDADSGPLSQECLSYLYMNQGITSHIGSTYDLPSWTDASMKGQPTRNTYCQPGTSLDPNTDAGLKIGQTLGGVEQAKNYYNKINRIANDDSRPNKEREKEIQQCFGVSLNPVVNNATPGPKQVFAVGPGYDYTRNQAAEVCAGYGAQVATKAQLAEAQTNGADWCFSGWVQDSTSGQWPITTSVIGGCGGKQGIVEWTHESNKAGVNCYGAKPAINTVNQGTVKPFNGTSWDQPSDRYGYTEVPNGYLQTTGPQPSCFSGLSPEQAKQGCNRLGDSCAGFSYSKDGAGHGCYKGNHNAGLINDSAYMGYVKTPLPKMKGRWIELKYDRVVCLNLAEIRVFSTSGGPNIINRNTPVTKSSGYNGDAFPSRNFVDGDTGQTYNFAHTSCYDIPWIKVDLGSTVDIFKIVIYNRADCCRERIIGAQLRIFSEGGTEIVYASDKINTTNRSYTWFPPSPVVIADAD